MLLVDTNIVLAATDSGSERYDDCRALLQSPAETLVTTAPAIAETAWLLLDRFGPSAQARFLRTVTSGGLAAVEMTLADWQRCLELVEQYSDLRVDVVDASLVAVAERLNISRVATFDRRDFGVIRARHVEALELLP